MQVERIRYLDGLRGVAIISVVLFHGYVAFPEKLPFGDRFSALPVRLGWQGVELFFLISGFVILMTLEKTKNLAQFARKRWLRLFPAMLLASLIVYAALIWADKPHQWSDLIPGLAFISPALIHAVTRIRLEAIDGAFWSLYTEVVFYAVFGSAYFIAGNRSAIALIFSLFLIAALLNVTMPPGDGILSRLAAAADWSGLIFFGWFASGALFYRYSNGGDRIDLHGALVAGIASALVNRYPLTDRIGLLAVDFFFFLSVVSPTLKRCLSWPPLLFVGFISYPFYLLHSRLLNIGLWLTFRSAAWLPDILLPLPAMIFIGFLAWLIARFWEPFFKSLFVSASDRIWRAENAPNI
jgi:peptidoglycan/LPS O-acetylase OafA/YrhL